jgi:hypothetical protein
MAGRIDWTNTPEKAKNQDADGGIIHVMLCDACAMLVIYSLLYYYID